MRFSLTVLTLLSLSFTFLSAESPKKNTVLLVHPFTNLSQKEYSWLAHGLTDTITNDLIMIKGILVITKKDRLAVMREIELSQTGIFGDKELQAVGALLGADLILTGSYQVNDRRVRIIAKLLNVADARIEKKIKLDGTMEDLFTLQNKIVLQLFDSKLTGKIEDLIAKKPAKDTETYKWYSMGIAEMHRNPRLAYAYFIKAISRDAHYIDALIAAGHTAAISLNKFSDSRDYTDRAFILTQKVYGKESVPHVKALLAVANVQYATRNFQTSLKKNMEAIEILESIDREDSYLYASALQNSALSYSNLRRYRDSIKYYEKAQDCHLKYNGRVTYNYLNMMRNIGVLHDRMRSYKKALEIYARARKLAEKMNLQNTKLYGGFLNNTAAVYQNQRRYREALPLYHQALIILEHLHLTQTKEYASTLCNIGNIYYETGDHITAKKYHNRAYELFKELGLHRLAEEIRRMY
jgi:TolB-like protein